MFYSFIQRTEQNMFLGQSFGPQLTESPFQSGLSPCDYLGENRTWLAWAFETSSRFEGNRTTLSETLDASFVNEIGGKDKFLCDESDRGSCFTASFLDSTLLHRKCPVLPYGAESLSSFCLPS